MMLIRGDDRLTRQVKTFYLVATAAFLLLMLFVSAQSVALGETTTTLPALQGAANNPGPYNSVPTGSDDATVRQYYHYLNLRVLGGYHEMYGVNPFFLSWGFGAAVAILIVLYFFVFSWYARQRTQDLYPVEVYNGYITERAGPVDAFNYVLYAILAGLMVAYTVWNIIYGQMY